MKPQKIGYARVSNADQNLELQMDMLRCYGVLCDRGRKVGRPRCDQKKGQQVVKLYQTGQYTMIEIEKVTGIKKKSLYGKLRKVEKIISSTP